MTKQCYGKFRGVVSDVADPNQQGRIRAIVPEVWGNQPGPWAYPSVPVGGSGQGFLDIPSPGTGVWVEFEAGDPTHPIWTGQWYGTGGIPSVAKEEYPQTSAWQASKLHISGDEQAQISSSEVLLSASASSISIRPSSITLTTPLFIKNVDVQIQAVGSIDGGYGVQGVGKIALQGGAFTQQSDPEGSFQEYQSAQQVTDGEDDTPGTPIITNGTFSEAQPALGGVTWNELEFGTLSLTSGAFDPNVPDGDRSTSQLLLSAVGDVLIGQDVGGVYEDQSNWSTQGQTSGVFVQAVDDVTLKAHSRDKSGLNIVLQQDRTGWEVPAYETTENPLFIGRSPNGDWGVRNVSDQPTATKNSDPSVQSSRPGARLVDERILYPLNRHVHEFTVEAPVSDLPTVGADTFGPFDPRVGGVRGNSGIDPSGPPIKADGLVANLGDGSQNLGGDFVEELTFTPWYGQTEFEATTTWKPESGTTAPGYHTADQNYRGGASELYPPGTRGGYPEGILSWVENIGGTRDSEGIIDQIAVVLDGILTTMNTYFGDEFTVSQNFRPVGNYDWYKFSNQWMTTDSSDREAISSIVPNFSEDSRSSTGWGATMKVFRRRPDIKSINIPHSYLARPLPVPETDERRLDVSPVQRFRNMEPTFRDMVEGSLSSSGVTTARGSVPFDATAQISDFLPGGSKAEQLGFSNKYKLSSPTLSFGPTEDEASYGSPELDSFGNGASPQTIQKASSQVTGFAGPMGTIDGNIVFRILQFSTEAEVRGLVTDGLPGARFQGVPIINGEPQQTLGSTTYPGGNTAFPGALERYPVTTEFLRGN